MIILVDRLFIGKYYLSCFTRSLSVNNLFEWLFNETKQNLGLCHKLHDFEKKISKEIAFAQYGKYMGKLLQYGKFTSKIA